MDIGVCNISFPEIRKKAVNKGKKLSFSVGFPLLYCCCSFDHTFCCYSELRDQNSTLTNLPPKAKARGKPAREQRTPLKEWYVCLETEQHIKNRTAAAGRPMSYWNRKKEKKVPECFQIKVQKLFWRAMELIFPIAPPRT